MKATIFLTAGLLSAATTTNAGLLPRATVQGFDVSNNQPNVNFAGAYKAGGARFVYIKATEGTSFVDPDFGAHWKAATAAKLVRGAYHFALPDRSGGAAQANYLLAHGGGWSAAGGRTLPAAVDLEADPYNKKTPCYGLSTAKMVAWIADFANEYHAKEKHYPVIYTSPSWWEECTGNSNKFAAQSPLWLASWGSAPGKIPGGWKTWTFWQNADTYKYSGDADKFNGDLAQLQKLAKSG